MMSEPTQVRHHPDVEMKQMATMVRSVVAPTENAACLNMEIEQTCAAATMHTMTSSSNFMVSILTVGTVE
jgi:hypothetical protein